MSRYVFVVLTNASGGRDDEFNEWYNNQHIPDVLKIPGFVAAQRFNIAGAQMDGATSPWRYLALYELRDRRSGRRAQGACGQSRHARDGNER